MKDIERLEEIIKGHKEMSKCFTKKTIIKMDVSSWNILIQLIENVIEENKELERHLKQRIKYTNELEKDLFENCSIYVIPKSKVKWKPIKEYDRKNMIGY